VNDPSQAAISIGRLTTNGLEALKGAFAKAVRVSTENPELNRLRTEVADLRSQVQRLDFYAPKRLKGGGLLVPAVLQFATKEERTAWLHDQEAIDVQMPGRYSGHA